MSEAPFPPLLIPFLAVVPFFPHLLGLELALQSLFADVVLSKALNFQISFEQCSKACLPFLMQLHSLHFLSPALNIPSCMPRDKEADI